jgi:hypothetical protein
MGVINLPSGMIGEVRGLTGRDGRYLTDEQKILDNEVEDFLLSHCWTRTLENGPYAIKGGGLPDWNDILIGDRFFALISIREATYPGKEYTIKVRCASRACRKPIEWDIDLRKLLAEKTKFLTPEAAETYKNGNRFTGTVPLFTPETSFVYKLKTGGDAKRTQKYIEGKKVGTKKMQERQNLLIDSLASSFVSVQTAAGPLTARDKIFDFLEDLPLGSIDGLLPLLQSTDCGVDTDIEIQCPRCREVMPVKLPFDRAFFLPQSAASKLLPESDPDETDEDSTVP